MAKGFNPSKSMSYLSKINRYLDAHPEAKQMLDCEAQLWLKKHNTVMVNADELFEIGYMEASDILMAKLPRVELIKIWAKNNEIEVD